VARQLSPLLGSNLRICLGAKTPVESGTDVTPMLHSKVVYTDNGDGTCTAFVGSHNWTGNALNGVNCEASVRVECAADDPFAVEIRRHLDQCARLCVPFNPHDLTYYKVLQRQLSTARPPAPEAEEVSAFQKLPGAPAVVIHAEGEEGRYQMEKTFLFLPIRQRSVAEWFSTTKPTTVLLFVYPKGTLLGQTSPLSRPVLFHGPVGANNDVGVSPSRATDVTCEIRDLSWPVVQDIPTRNIPPVNDELYQVVAELRRAGPVEIPVYQRGKQPMLEVGVRFGDEPEGAELFDERAARATLPTNQIRRLGDLVGWYDEESMRQGALFFTEPTPERVIKLDVPEQWLYTDRVDELVLRCLSRKQDQGFIRIALKPEKGTQAYFYRASFVLEH
jgi:hypothetical protein